MNTPAYKSVVILYNPNSTGNSKENAQTIKKEITKKSSNKLPVTLLATEYAGHAEEIARDYAEQGDDMLLISSSGDGGYHELINGIMSARDASHITVSLIPSGNANDHFNAISNGDYVTHVVDGTTHTMDVIKVTSTVDGKSWVRYAHSYVGFGISAYIGKHLTNTDLNIFNEKLIVLKGLLTFRYTRLAVDGRVKKYSSLVFSNIDRMSKVLKLSDSANIDDGKIEINEIRYRNPFMTIIYLLKMIFVDISERRSVSHFTLTTVGRTPIQIDGEDFALDANSDAKIDVVEQALKYVG